MSLGATTTNTIISQAQLVDDDKYGNTVYEQNITIETKDFKVKNFWKGFSLNGNAENETNFSSVAKSGVFYIVTEATSACTLDGKLSSNGCSGQKPFLLNNEVLSNPISGTTDEYEVVFSLSKNFNNTDGLSFYPLDVVRDVKYYKDTNTTDPTADRGFCGFFTSRFDYMFAKTIGFGSDFFGDPDIADVRYTDRSNEAEDRRQRYIANIIAGIDKEHRMTKSVNGSSSTKINAPELNTPVSLLHYDEANKLTIDKQCQFMFLDLSSEGLMCRIMGGFGMDAWMPFFTKSSVRMIDVNMIVTDTENSLLAMTADIEKKQYMEDVGGDDNYKLTFLQNLLKPMTTFIDYMKVCMFGSSKATLVADPVERVYEFNEDDAMTLSFAITNEGTQIDDFENFKLLKIRSVYGDMLDSCRVKKERGIFFSWNTWDITFYLDGTNSEGTDGEDGPDGYMSNTEWVDWCQTAADKKGMLSYLLDWQSGGIFNPINWLKSFINAFLSFFFGSYTVEDITSGMKRALILNIKKVDLDPLSTLNSRTIKVKEIHRGKN
jgi:hypothetical protein